ncbi:unnamed protein product [Scytosiphon promiscuus]
MSLLLWSWWWSLLSFSLLLCCCLLLLLLLLLLCSRIAFRYRCVVLLLLWLGRQKIGGTIHALARKCGEFLNRQGQDVRMSWGVVFSLAAQAWIRCAWVFSRGSFLSLLHFAPFYLCPRCRVNSQICRGEFVGSLSVYAHRQEEEGRSLLHIHVETPGVQPGMYLFMKCCSMGGLVSRFAPARFSLLPTFHEGEPEFVLQVGPDRCCFVRYTRYPYMSSDCVCAWNA